MDKFAKRIKKLSNNTTAAVVIGTGFGNLERILSIFNTVFVIGGNFPSIKAKNLIYKEDFSNINNITEVGAIFFDLNRIDQLVELKDFWQKNKSSVFVEGDEPIGREFSKPFYNTGWQCTSTQGAFHVWEKIK